MSDHTPVSYVVTFRYQEKGLGDLQSLNSAMVNAGYATTLHDADGHAHELGINSFGIVSTLPEQALADQAGGVAEVALHQRPQVAVTTLDAYLKAQA